MKIVDDTDAGNSNITEDEATKLIDTLKELTDKEKRLSKYAACEYLNVSRATFDNYVREDITILKSSMKCSTQVVEVSIDSLIDSIECQKV